CVSPARAAAWSSASWPSRSRRAARSCRPGRGSGAQPAGDLNNDNCVDITDFSTLRSSFGWTCGEPAYNANADYDNDCISEVTDFSLLRGNFGACGPLGLAGPAGPR